MRITGKELNLAEDVFKLQHLLDCHLLKVRDDMEELTTSAVKEEQIEGKLATVSADWAEINLVFADYKSRGTVILKVGSSQQCQCLLLRSKANLNLTYLHSTLYDILHSLLKCSSMFTQYTSVCRLSKMTCTAAVLWHDEVPITASHVAFGKVMLGCAGQ